MYQMMLFADVLLPGLVNFESIYRFEVDFWTWYDNSGATPIVIDEGDNV
jgi:hypothetical protein